MARPRPEVSQKNKAAFLACYAESGNITHAAQAANVERRNHPRWLQTDPAYAEAFEQATKEAVQRMEEEARRRAVDGWVSPVYQGGKKVGTVRHFSDLLLIFMLKAARPEVYRDNLHVTGAITHQHDLAARLAAGRERLQEPEQPVIDVTAEGE